MTAGGTATTIDSAAQTFSAGDRMHIMCTWDNTNGELYVNGTASPAQTKTQRTIEPANWPDYIYIGGQAPGYSDYHADGYIDEVIIWNGNKSSSYATTAYGRETPFGDLLPGMLFHANYDYTIDAVGCGDVGITYAGTVTQWDYIQMDMEKQTVREYDVSAFSDSNKISNVTGNFYFLMPGINIIHVEFTGAGGDPVLMHHWINKYL